MRIRDPRRALERALLLALALALSSTAAQAAPAPAAPGLTSSETPPSAVRSVNGIRDTGQFLPDTAMLARVDEKRFTARDFVLNYYNAYPPDRPAPDSLGRVKFLGTLVDKEVLGRTARNVGYDIGFEGRVVMREHTQRVLSNALFERAVLDSVQVTEQDILAVYEQFKQAVRVRHILFADRATAERVRLDLQRGRITWRAAVQKYSRAIGDRGPDGDMGWVRRGGLSFAIADQVYGTRPGQISQVVEDEAGPQLLQIVEVRADTPPSYDALSGLIRKQLFQARVSEHAGRLQTLLVQRVDFRPDTGNIGWACKLFPKPSSVSREGGSTALNVDASVPVFADEDTSRILARWHGGSITLSRFVIEYGEIPPMVRPAVNTPENMTTQVANIALEPYKAQIAVERGYDKDPRYVAQIETRREKILVERMYSDTILAHVRATPEERRAEYDTHPDRYEVPEVRRFATILRLTRAGADSLTAALRAGANPESVIAADQAAGFHSGTMHELRSDEHGVFKKIVFEEMKAGDITEVEADKPGSVAVVQLLSVSPGRKLSFDEAQAMADEHVRDDEAEALTQAWLARLRHRHRLETHPELVMRVRLIDPAR